MIVTWATSCAEGGGLVECTMMSGTMSRREKGRVAPPPALAEAPQAVADAVARLPGVTVQAHWEIGSQDAVNGTDFYVGEEELGHIHLDGEAHVPLGAAVVEALVKAGLARRFRWSGAFAVVDTDDVEQAVWVFSLRHRQIGGLHRDEVAALIGERRRRVG